MTLNPSTGVISGTVNSSCISTVTGFSFSVTVQDSAGATSIPLALNIAVYPALRITTPTALPLGIVGVAYPPPSGVISDFMSDGGDIGLSGSIWSATGLPNGVTVSPRGLLSGIPAPGSQANYNPQITVRDNANGATTVTLPLTTSTTEIPPLQFTTPSTLPPAKQNGGYDQTLTVSGGYPSYSNWAIVAGALPPGMALSDEFLVGNPTAFGTFTFTIQVSDAIGFSTRQAFNLVVTPAVTITTMLYAYPVGAPLGISMSATGGTAPSNWSVISGSLPPGVTLSGAGLLAGTPTASGSYSFGVRVTDRQSNSATAALNTGVLQPLKITTTALPSGSIGVNYGIQLTGSGGYSSYSWSLTSGSLPPGFSLTSGGNLWSPLRGRNLQFRNSTNRRCYRSCLAEFQHRHRANRILIYDFGLTDWDRESNVLRGLRREWPHATLYIFARLRFVASGISVNELLFIRSGRRVCGRHGIVHVCGGASDSASASITRTFTIVITNGYGITIQLPPATLGVNYSQTLSTNGVGTPPYSLALSPNSSPLAAGLSLSSTGIISGVPSESGPQSIITTVTDVSRTIFIAIINFNVNGTSCFYQINPSAEWFLPHGGAGSIVITTFP